MNSLIAPPLAAAAHSVRTSPGTVEARCLDEFGAAVRDAFANLLTSQS